MISVPKHISKIVMKAASQAIPDIKEPIVFTADHNKEWDYSSPTVIKIFNMTKK